jgi:hypothetical protein
MLCAAACALVLSAARPAHAVATHQVLRITQDHMGNRIAQVQLNPNGVRGTVQIGLGVQGSRSLALRQVGASVAVNGSPTVVNVRLPPGSNGLNIQSVWNGSHNWGWQGR